MAQGDKTLRNFFKNGVIAFCISSITVNIFELMELPVIERVAYLTIKFAICGIISIGVGIGSIVADILYYWIKKNKENEQLFSYVR